MLALCLVLAMWPFQANTMSVPNAIEITDESVNSAFVYEPNKGAQRAALELTLVAEQDRRLPVYTSWFRGMDWSQDGIHSDAVGQLVMVFNIGGQLKTYAGSATLAFGGKGIITAAHNFVQISKLSGTLYPLSMVFYYQRAGEKHYKTKAKVLDWEVYPGYFENDDILAGTDLAIARLEHEIPCTTQCVALHSVEDFDDAQRYRTDRHRDGGPRPFTVIGYPGEKDSYPFFGVGTVTVRSAAGNGNDDALVWLYNGIDTTRGQSGSPLLTQHFMVGVHVGADEPAGYNVATAITASKLEWISLGGQRLGLEPVKPAALQSMPTCAWMRKMMEGLPMQIVYVTSAAPNSHVNGAYSLVFDRLEQDRPVWHKSGSAYYLFYDKSGHWLVGRDLTKPTGWIKSRSSAVFPYKAGAWESWDGHSWKHDADIIVEAEPTQIVVVTGVNANCNSRVNGAYSLVLDRLEQDRPVWHNSGSGYYLFYGKYGDGRRGWIVGPDPTDPTKPTGWIKSRSSAVFPYKAEAWEAWTDAWQPQPDIKVAKRL